METPAGPFATLLPGFSFATFTVHYRLLSPRFGRYSSPVSRQPRERIHPETCGFFVLYYIYNVLFSLAHKDFPADNSIQTLRRVVPDRPEIPAHEFASNISHYVLTTTAAYFRTCVGDRE